MNQRPKTSRSATSAKFSKFPSIRSRPTSAKDWFESNNQKRNEDAWKHEELVTMVNNMKRREWQAKMYTSLGQKRDNTELGWREKEEMEKKLDEKKKRLRNLFAEDERKYEAERKERGKRGNKLLSPSLTHPEIELLRKRLDQLKRQNEEQRKKMAEELSYEAWRKNNPELRKVESERFSRFVRDTWIDQKQWREDERRAEQEERRKSEEEAAEKRRMEEEEERRREEERREERLHLKAELDAQVERLKAEERMEEELGRVGAALEEERSRLQKVIEEREKVKAGRERKKLEVFWARQYQLKLKKKAADVLSELTEDEMLVQDLLRASEQENTQVALNRDEGERMLRVLQEQKRLEKLREKEYDLIFSEEAEKMWSRREAEWMEEQRARDNLMEDVMRGLKDQLCEKMSSTRRALEDRRGQRDTVLCSLAEIRDKMDHVGTGGGHGPRQLNGDTTRRNKDLWEDGRVPPRDQALRSRNVEDHQREIARLEAEMQSLWQQSYVPPKFGRKNTGLMVMKPTR